MKKRVVIMLILTIAFWTIVRAIKVVVDKIEIRRYVRTAVMFNGFTWESESVLTNVYHDAWGRVISIKQCEGCWSVVSLGHDPADPSDDILMKWNPGLGQINVDFKYDGHNYSYSRNEE